MTREEVIKVIELIDMRYTTLDTEERQALRMAIKALEQEPRKDEVILTKKEYGELVSSEFDNGYTKGYTEALEQNDVLDKIKAEITEHADRLKDSLYGDGMRHCVDIIDKYKAESEDK